MSGMMTPQRLLNQSPSPDWGMVPRLYGKSVYIHGQAEPPGLEGGYPVWIPTEFPAMPPFDTLDTTLGLPDDFTLLSFVANWSQPGAFAVQLYDPIRGVWFMDKPCDVRTVAGSLGNSLIQRIPYSFPKQSATCFVRVMNQDAGPANNDVMIALFGVSGGEKD